MAAPNTSWIVSFIWNIADDVLRDVYVRGKYRDIILPMTVIRRLDAVLEPTKQEVLRLSRQLDAAGIADKRIALTTASKQAFYNDSPFTLSDLKARARQQQLRQDFEAYLHGFSPNVQEILNKFEFYNKIPRLVETDVLGSVIEKFTGRDINLGPNPVFHADGTVRLPGLDNHAMGTIFEELIRRFNEENNEEAGEHFTPRDVVQLMANLIFAPVAGAIMDGTYRVYDGAAGTGGMLTVAEETLDALAREHGKQASIHLFGQEINAETYAICKADLLLKGEGSAADHIAFGSTLASDAFPNMTFDFMLSNPPYGKSWKTDLERMGSKKSLTDPRFVVTHAGEELSLITRSSDGQLMFLANKVAKMNTRTALGSRIAEVHNGSSLFTGDAGQGESNIRRWIIENDWLEAIVALPLNMFYNTGIATYIWLLSNRKAAHRQGKVQLIDATALFTPLRKNMGNKNCELTAVQIQQITDVVLAFEETEQSKLFANEAFGYWKIVVERPLRYAVDLSVAALAALRASCETADEAPLSHLLDAVAEKLGPGPHLDFNALWTGVEAEAKRRGVKLTAKRTRLVESTLCRREASAAPVVRTIHRADRTTANPLGGLYATETGVVEYEPDTELRDSEQIPLLEPGGIEAFFVREVLPWAADAWIDHSKTQIGYEINFNRHFYKPKPMRTLAEIVADLEALQAESEGLLERINGVER